MNNPARGLKAGILSALGARGFLLASGFALSVLLVKVMTKPEVGAFYILLQTVTLGGLICLGGTNNSLQKFLSVQAGEEAWLSVRQTLLRSLRILAVGSSLFLLLLFLSWDGIVLRLEVPALGVLFWPAFFLCLIYALEELGSAFFRGTMRFHTGLWLRGVPQQILFLGILFSLWMAGEKEDLATVVRWRVLAGVAAIGLAAVLVIREIVRRGDNAAAAPAAPTTRQLALISMPMVFSLVAANLLGTVDLWCVGLFKGAGEAAVYGTMLRLALLLGAFLQVVNGVLPAVVARMHHQGQRKEMEHLLRRLATLTFAGASLVLLAFYFWGRALIGRLYGEEFLDGYLVLMILAVGQSVNVWAGSPGWVLQMTGHQGLLLRITLATLAANLVLNLMVVGAYGGIGVATVSAACLVAQNLAMVYSARKLVGVTTYAYLFPQRTPHSTSP